MKKKLALLLAFALCLALAGCGKKDPPPPLWETDPLLSAAEGCEAVLRVQFNPEFELYIDALGQVLQVNCLNADAEAAFADCDVVGMEVNEALEMMLTAAWEREYLTNERTVTITPVAVADKSAAADIVAQIPQMVAQITADLGADCAVNVQDAVVVSNDDHGKIRTKTTVGGGTTRTEYYRDGVIIGSLEQYADGSWCQAIHDRYGRYVPNESEYGGTRFDWPEAGGTVTAHERDGVSTVTLRADGTIARVCTETTGELAKLWVYEEWNYGIDGKSAENLQIMPDNFKTTRTTYADIDQGLISHRSEIYGDGGAYETEYENGLAVYRSGTTWDGAFSKTTFDKNGFEKQTVETYPSGAMRITWYREFPAGTVEFIEPVCKIEEYAAGGTLTFYKTITEGENGEWVSYYEKYDEPGYVKKTCEHTIFSDGTTHTVNKWTREDGIVEVIESANGESISRYYIYPDGTTAMLKICSKCQLTNEPDWSVCFRCGQPLGE